MPTERKGARSPCAAWQPYVCSVAIILATGWRASADDSRQHRADESHAVHWRSGPFCGVNSTYALLRILGIDVSYDYVRDRVPVTAAGSNLKDMKDCAAGAGVETVVLKGAPDDLLRIAPPFVAHFERDEGDAFLPSDRGHFVVVLSADAQSVRYIDGATARIEVRSSDAFIRGWTGFLLVPRSGEYLDRPLQDVALALLMAGIIAGLWRYRGAARAAFVGATEFVLRRRVST